MTATKSRKSNPATRPHTAAQETALRQYLASVGFADDCWQVDRFISMSRKVEPDNPIIPGMSEETWIALDTLIELEVVSDAVTFGDTDGMAMFSREYTDWAMEDPPAGYGVMYLVENALTVLKENGVEFYGDKLKDIVRALAAKMGETLENILVGLTPAELEAVQAA